MRYCYLDASALVKRYTAVQMRFLAMNDEVAARALPVMLRHNLNASDALYLQQVLDWQAEHDVRTDMVILVAADERLLRAAHAEGIETLSPETDPLDRAVHLFAV